MKNNSYVIPIIFNNIIKEISNLKLIWKYSIITSLTYYQAELRDKNKNKNKNKYQKETLISDRIIWTKEINWVNLEEFS